MALIASERPFVGYELTAYEVRLVAQWPDTNPRLGRQGERGKAVWAQGVAEGERRAMPAYHPSTAFLSFFLGGLRQENLEWMRFTGPRAAGGSHRPAGVIVLEAYQNLTKNGVSCIIGTEMRGNARNCEEL